MASAEVERPIIVELVDPEPPQPPVELGDDEASSAVAERRPERPRGDRRRAPNNNNNNNNNTQQQNQHNKRYRHDNDGRYFRPYGRKRSHSFNGGGGKFGPPHKRWKRDFIVPPTKFLLGGNICDPLNLNSMQDEEINRCV